MATSQPVIMNWYELGKLANERTKKALVQK